MEFSFEIPAWMDMFLEKPMLIVAWAAFGMPVFAFLFMLICKWISEIFKYKFLKTIMSLLGISFLFTWLAGFVLMMVMFFSEIHPVKLIFCWFSLLITTFVFCIIEQRLILKWIDSQTEIPLVKKKKKS